jgi:hypothetical protein
MDKVIVTTRCLNCEKKVAESLRWFHEHEALCACGGQFDTSPLDEYILFLAGRRESKPNSIRVLSDIR